MSITISFFNSTRETKAAKTMSLDFFLQAVENGTWQDIVLKYRNLPQGEDRASFKRKLPAISPSGKFAERKADALEAHSGILCMDIDDKDNPEMQIEQLQSDPFVYAYHRSVGGYGYAVYFLIEPTKHLEAYHAIEKHLADSYHLICDPACKDTSRLRFVSFDPHLYRREGKTQVFKRYLKQPKAEARRYYPHTKSDIDHILTQIGSRGIDLVDSYFDWIQIGFALAGEYGEQGRHYFHCISQQGTKYDAAKCDAKYNECLKSGKGRVRINTFFYKCKEAGIEIQTEESRKVERYTKAQMLQGFKSDAEIVESVTKLAKQDGIATEIAQDIAEQTLAIPRSELTKEKQANLLPEIRAALATYGLKRNEVTGIVEYQDRPLTDWDVNTIWGEIADNLGSRCAKSTVEDIINSDATPSYNPFTEFFAKHQDKTPQNCIDKLAECITPYFDGETEENARAIATIFIRKWIVSIVASMHGTYSLLILVLVGGQGIGKTNFFRWLLPEELRDYYGESKLDSGKDDAMLMTSKLILCDDEFSGKSKSEYKHLKDISSKQWFNMRLPYGRRTQDFRRYAVLCGTSNDSEIINDPTGNRRIVPINVKSIDFQAFKAIDKVDLLLEAYHIYKTEGDASWQLEKQDIQLLNDSAKSNEQVDTVEEAILMYFEKTEVDIDANWWTTTEIVSHMMQYTKLHFNMTRIGIAMKNLGFPKASRRKNGKVMRCYWVRERVQHKPDNSYYG
jgi:predicted P-loop ATPase